MNIPRKPSSAKECVIHANSYSFVYKNGQTKWNNLKLIINYKKSNAGLGSPNLKAPEAKQAKERLKATM